MSLESQASSDGCEETPLQPTLESDTTLHSLMDQVKQILPKYLLGDGDDYVEELNILKLEIVTQEKASSPVVNATEQI